MLRKKNCFLFDVFSSSSKPRPFVIFLIVLQNPKKILEANASL